MTLAAAFADIGLAFSAQFGGPYHRAQTIEHTPAEYDRGGTIITPGQPFYRPCMVQIDAATDAMRRAPSFVEKDVRFIVLSATLEGALGTDARIEVLEGPFAGVWSVSSLERDPAAVGWVGTGRRG